MSSEGLRLSIADTVDRLRAQRNWSFRRVAREAGLSGQTLFALVKGNINTRLSTIEALAAAFDCDVRVVFRPRHRADAAQDQSTTQPSDRTRPRAAL